MDFLISLIIVEKLSLTPEIPDLLIDFFSDLRHGREFVRLFQFEDETTGETWISSRRALMECEFFIGIRDHDGVILDVREKGSSHSARPSENRPCRPSRSRILIVSTTFGSRLDCGWPERLPFSPSF